MLAQSNSFYRKKKGFYIKSGNYMNYEFKEFNFVMKRFLARYSFYSYIISPGGWSMFSLLNIEWIKMKRSLFFKILLLLLIIGIVGYYIYIFSNTMGADEVSEILESSLVSEKEQLAHLELLEQEEGDSFDQSSRHALKQYREWVPAHQAQIDGIASSDWTKWANGNIITRNFSETNLPEYWEHKYQSRFTLETHKSMLEWMRDRNIQPLWPNNFWLTQYDVYFDEGIEPIVRNDF